VGGTPALQDARHCEYLASREVVGFHGAAVGNCDCIEFQVELFRQIEGDAIGTLRLHYSLILSEDYLFEIL